MPIQTDANQNNVRRQRGMEIAATKKLKQKGGLWIVPSATGSGSYVVDEDVCTCPDFTLRRGHCKHWWAVSFVTKRETVTDGNTTTVTETQTLRIEHKRHWTTIKLSQTMEKERFAELLHGLCDGIVQPPQGKGRPRLSLADVIFSDVMKVYGTMSGTRTDSDLRDYAAEGMLTRKPSVPSLFRYMKSTALTPILKTLIEESAAPLRSIESNFAVDSTGFSTCTYQRWLDVKHNKEVPRRVYVKAHLMCGTTTHIVTSAEVTASVGDDTADCTQFVPLVETTAKRFEIGDVSADKAYLSKANLEKVDSLGGTAYIPFKINMRGGHGPEVWRTAFHTYNARRPEFLEHYGQRSQVETVNSSIKRKFGNALRSKTYEAQVNEVLCKILCHNLCVLVQSIYDLGLSPTFWTKATTEFIELPEVFEMIELPEV